MRDLFFFMKDYSKVRTIRIVTKLREISYNINIKVLGVKFSLLEKNQRLHVSSFPPIVASI